VDNMCKFWV